MYYPSTHAEPTVGVVSRRVRKAHGDDVLAQKFVVFWLVLSLD